MTTKGRCDKCGFEGVPRPCGQSTTDFECPECNKEFAILVPASDIMRVLEDACAKYPGAFIKPCESMEDGLWRNSWCLPLLRKCPESMSREDADSLGRDAVVRLRRIHVKSYYEEKIIWKHGAGGNAPPIFGICPRDPDPGFASLTADAQNDFGRRAFSPA
jgi:hypothetical protein